MSKQICIFLFLSALILTSNLSYSHTRMTGGFFRAEEDPIFTLEMWANKKRNQWKGIDNIAATYSYLRVNKGDIYSPHHQISCFGSYAVHYINSDDQSIPFYFDSKDNCELTKRCIHLGEKVTIGVRKGDNEIIEVNLSEYCPREFPPRVKYE